MPLTYNTGVILTGTPGSTVTQGSTALDTRQTYDFGDTVFLIDPVRAPFFAYLSQMAKMPVASPEFKMLEDRTLVDVMLRNFYLNGAHDVSSSSEGDTFSFDVTTLSAGSAAVKWIIPGMVFNIGFIDSGNNNPEPLQILVESNVTHGGSSTTFTGRIIEDPTSSIASHSSNDNTECQLVGTNFAEATGAPDVWSSEVQSQYGYTQIFKTAATWSGTMLATEYRGYRSERERVWAEKLLEHAMLIERAMIFQSVALRNSQRYSWGVLGFILANQNLATGTTAFTYTSGSSFVRQVAYSSLTYDVFLGDLEVINDPIIGGDRPRLVMAGLPVASALNKLGNNNFLDLSTASTQVNLNIDISNSKGVFGHKILNIQTVNGDLHVLRNPILRGISKDYMFGVDMKQLKYRPLVGNGVSRDTFISTNVQAADEDLRKDMITTEAGLQPANAESLVLWSFN